MGLDSVELVMDFEDYFGISIPNADAEKLTHIHSVVSYISRRLDLLDSTSTLKEITLAKLIAALKTVNACDELFENNLAYQYLDPSDKQQLALISEMIGLPLPDFRLPETSGRSIWGRLKKVADFQPMFDWKLVTIGRINDAVNAHNLAAIINKDKLLTPYEVYIAVSKITVDKAGVDYLEIQPEKSFTSDLGID